MSSLFMKTALGLLAANAALANPGLKLPASPGYRGSDVCPSRCTDTGPNPGNWTRYQNLNQFDACNLVVFQAFSIFDNVDDDSKKHGLYACSSTGADFTNTPDNSSSLHAATAGSINNATLQVGWWNEDRDPAAADIASAAKQIRQYMAGGFGSVNTTDILYARSGRAAVGVYLGSGLHSNGVSGNALKTMEDNVASLDASSRSVAMQFCEPDFTSEHIFGFFATSNRSFAPVQQAIQSWSNATCLDFPNSLNFTGEVTLTSPIITTTPSNMTVSDNSTVKSNFTMSRHASKHIGRRASLHARGECSTVQVVGGDSCGSLAKKCGISGPDFTKYNSGDGFCSKLRPGQHVCCSSGDLPDFRPKPNSDGSCHSYYVPKDDNCANIAAANSLTNDDLEEFNKETWAWDGCEHLQFNMNICLSKGRPPLPAPVSNAVCGPQKPGTKAPTDGTKLADLNQCPLNACCDAFGQCGITKEFCEDTSTGAPGSRKPGTNGCISNCGTDIVRGSGPSEFRKIAYYEGYGLQRECLLQDALQIDTSKYTHLHFGFGTLTNDYEVETGDIYSSYEFQNFRRMTGVKRIISFGGWAFSTDAATYHIFREGVTAANRAKMAHSLADFVNKNDLDGVDIDWEYPGAPDIPGIPPGGKDDGTNYLAFLVLLKNLLGPGKSVSIAAPSSYWYLRAYPLEKMAKVVDYIIYMTYDLHGQWDAQNPNSQEGCANGNCLRSQVNLTETMSSLAMITKAKVPSGKVVVGVTSYGRSFNMAEAGCYGPDCLYTGSRSQSDATKGKCTNTAGYISNAEIKDIMKDSSRVTKSFVDTKSNSNILVYDGNQYVAYMDDDIKAHRHTLYSALGMGGTTDWATDLESYNDVPKPSKSWAEFKLAIKAGKNPWSVGERNGNWTDVQCDDRAAADIRFLSPSERWDQMDCEDAWKDIIDVWKKYDRGKNRFPFTESLSLTMNGPPQADCGDLTSRSNCDQTLQCDGFANKDSGPAAWVIWNSFVLIHEAYQSYNDALYRAAASAIDPALKDFENKFSPIPPEKDNKWLLLLLDLVTVGVSAAAAPFFNNFLSELPYFIEKGTDNLKDLTNLAIGQSTTIAKDLLDTPESKWTESSQAEFSNYLGQAITAWGNTTSSALERMFDGSDKSIDTLHALLADGKFLSGSGGEISTKPPKTSEADLEANIAKAFFAYAIPNAWTFSKHYAFIVDSGYGCDAQDPMGDYIDADVQHNTYGCVDNKLYYLVAAKGDSKSCHCVYTKSHCDRVCTNTHFSAPPGLDSLDGKSFGGVSVGDLIKGSVRTYTQNGNTNGGGFVDVTNDGSFKDLAANDVTTPGFIRLPVCSPEHAYKTWDTAGPKDDPTYPCNVAKGPDHCQDSSFENQTSDASPLVSDCKKIIENIQGDGGATWTTGISGQRELVHYGTCKFGVQSKAGADGDVTFKVGAQDIIDLINESIKRFGGGGKVGAKGIVDCDGNVHSTTIEWGLY